MNDTETKKLSIDSLVIKRYFEKTKKSLLEQIINENDVKLRLNLKSPLDADTNKLFDSLTDNRIKGINNKLDKNINYDVGLKFLDFICDSKAEKRYLIIDSLFSVPVAIKIKEILSKSVHPEVIRKSVFDEIFTTVVTGLLGLKNTKKEEFNLLAESQNPATQHLLFDKNIKETDPSGITYIRYSVCDGLMDLLFDPKIDKTAYDMLFDKESILKTLLDNPRIKPKNLVINDDICLEKQSKYVQLETIDLDSEPIDFAVDFCGTIFMLEELNGNPQLKIISGDTKKIIKDNLTYAKKIEVNNTYIFVLKEVNNNSSIDVFSRGDFKLLNTFEQKEFDSNKIADFSLDANDNVILMTFKNTNTSSSTKSILHVYRINSDDPYRLVHVCAGKEKEEKKQASIQDLQNIQFLATSKKNNNIYVLDSQAEIIVVFDQKMQPLHNIKINNKKIRGFQLMDGNNFMITRDKDKTITNYYYGSQNLITSTEFPTGILYFNKKGDFYALITKSDSKENNIAHFHQQSKHFDEGELVIGPFDSKEFGTTWHKIQTDVSILDTEQTGFTVSYFSDESLVDDEFDWKDLPTNPYDSLIDATGRYLWLKLTLFSNTGIDSPIFKSITIHFPRATYLKYLPKIYQENKTSRETLEKFLSLFEKFFDDIDDKVFSFHKMLDPKTTNDDFLHWLTRWIALNYDSRWPNAQLRNYLKNAHHLYHLRGTISYLKHTIMLYLDPNYKLLITGEKDSVVSDNLVRNKLQTVNVFENFRYHNTKSSVVNYDPFSFTVYVNSSVMDEEKLNVVRSIVENEKPAHTIGKVHLLVPMFILNGHTYVGVNSVLIMPDLILAKSSLGYTKLRK